MKNNKKQRKTMKNKKMMKNNKNQKNTQKRWKSVRTIIKTMKNNENQKTRAKQLKNNENLSKPWKTSKKTMKNIENYGKSIDFLMFFWFFPAAKKCRNRGNGNASPPHCSQSNGPHNKLTIPNIFFLISVMFFLPPPIPRPSVDLVCGCGPWPWSVAVVHGHALWPQCSVARGWI